MQTAGLILAAGMSKRMGTFKQLLPLNGKPLVVHAADLFFSAGVSDVYVVTGFRAEDIHSALLPRPVRFVHNPAYASTEMFDSVRIGLERLLDSETERVFLLPADMPFVPGSILPLLAARMDETDADAVFPSTGTHRLHPPLLSRECFERLYSYSGENGLRGAFASCAKRIEYVLTDEIGCSVDVDTPKDYETLLELAEHRKKRMD